MSEALKGFLPNCTRFARIVHTFQTQLQIKVHARFGVSLQPSVSATCAMVQQ